MEVTLHEDQRALANTMHTNATHKLYTRVLMMVNMYDRNM